MKHSKNFKKWMLSLAVVLLSIGANAQDFTIDDIDYNVIDETHAMVIANGYSGSISIPEMVTPNKGKYNKKTFMITTIAANAFANCKDLTSVTLGKFVKVIEGNAFAGCSNLASINLVNVTTIGNNAFKGCSNLSDININSATSIGSGAFQGCSSLTSVSIPAAVTTIEDNLFQNCTGLTTVTTAGNIKA